MEAERPNPRLLNMLFAIYVAAALGTAALIAYGVWDAAHSSPAPGLGGSSPASDILAQNLARQGMERRMIIQVGAFIAFAWLAGVLLLRLRTSYLGLLAQSRDLREEIVDLLRKDPLTGIGNRRAMTDELARVTAQADREGKPLAFAVINVDLLKQLNDAQGYKAGDACLIALASIMQGCARRPLDLAVRLGGDEFMLCWYDTSAEFALEMAQSMQHKLRIMPLRHTDGAPITLSIGLSRRQANSELSWENMLRQAEDAMRHAKSAGRNQIAGS